jgi:hypothetical protein
MIAKNARVMPTTRFWNRKLRVFDRAGVLYSTSENCPGLGKTIGRYIIFDKTSDPDQ